MIPLATQEVLPIEATGAVVLAVSILITVAWLWHLYR